MTHIRYIDGNNLYGSQMLCDLPIDDYKFEDILMDMRIHRPSEFTGTEGKTLSKDEKDILYLKTFL